MLKAIEKQVGTKTMDRIMRTYFQRWEFKHPSTKDFQNVVEEVTKTKWDDFFNQYVYGAMMMDYSVESIRRQILRAAKELSPTKVPFSSPNAAATRLKCRSSSISLTAQCWIKHGMVKKAASNSN